MLHTVANEHEEVFCDLVTSNDTHYFLHLNNVGIFSAPMVIRFPIANSCTSARWCATLKRLSQDGDCMKLAENLRTSPFNEGLEIDTTFIYLVGPYL
jgi:hypothetical protein